MITFDDIKQKIAAVEFDVTFDLIVAIANGGIIPAAIINQRLNVEMQLLKINWRDPQQKPKYAEPQLLVSPEFEYENKSILLVEDRVKTGTTLEFAKNSCYRKQRL